MVVVLPPVDGVHAHGHDASYRRLSQQPLLQVDDAVALCQIELSGLRSLHVSNEQRRQEALVRAENRARRREAKQERIRMKHMQAIKIQALVRSYFVRAYVLPTYREAKRMKELENSRMALTETMLGLHQNIHDLAFLEKDRTKAATQIQAKWRAVLAKRVVGIIVIRHHLQAVSMVMAQAATRIQAIARGRQARMGCFRLRREKEKRMRQAKKMQDDRMVKSVIKIQSHVRRRAAIRETQARREMLAKELEGDAGTSPHEGRERSETIRKSPGRADRSRRKRDVDTHANNPARQRAGTHPEQAALQDLKAFEAGSMLVADVDSSEQRRKSSYGASHGHKGKKPSRPRLNS